MSYKILMGVVALAFFSIGITFLMQQKSSQMIPGDQKETAVVTSLEKEMVADGADAMATATLASDFQDDKVIPRVSEKSAFFANGCFWCVEHDLEEVVGVKKVVSGYMGGQQGDPTYDTYARLGHREVVQVTYDPSKVSYGNLVEHVIKHGDPTDAEGSFKDRGFEYAPAIYYASEEEKAEARRVIDAIDALKVFPEALPIAVLSKHTFYPAEEYHQDYSKKNPVRYGYYRAASGRTAFIEKTWGERLSRFEVSVAPKMQVEESKKTVLASSFNSMTWKSFSKPSPEELKKVLTPLQFKVTQEEGTEPSFNNAYDKEYREGIYVDIVSGEPLFLSKDKFDSGTGWPSFVKPLAEDVVILKEDKKLFSTRTEVRSRYADSHVGHVFDDGPQERGGKRYCMNSAALRFIAKDDMEKEGYGYLLSSL